MKSVYLDPDFRKSPKTGRFCVRCQRDMNNLALDGGVRVSVDWDKWLVWRDPNGEHLIGSDCARKIKL